MATRDRRPTQATHIGTKLMYEYLAVRTALSQNDCFSALRFVSIVEATLGTMTSRRADSIARGIITSRPAMLQASVTPTVMSGGNPGFSQGISKFGSLKSNLYEGSSSPSR